MIRLLVTALLLAGPAAATTYELPADTTAFPPGANLEAVQSNCSACHSADYVSTQPRRLANPRAFWQAEVAKMKAAYGAPIDAEDAPKIVDYLVATFGQPGG